MAAGPTRRATSRVPEDQRTRQLWRLNSTPAVTMLGATSGKGIVKDRGLDSNSGRLAKRLRFCLHAKYGVLVTT